MFGSLLSRGSSPAEFDVNVWLTTRSRGQRGRTGPRVSAVAHLAAVARVLPETPCLRRPTTNPPIWWDIYPKSGLSDKSQVRAGGFHRFR